MLPKINPTTTEAWKNLEAHAEEMKQMHLRELFSNDTHRFEKFTLNTKDILFDYSKNIIAGKTIQLLLQLAGECRLKDAIEAMFNGDKINVTENRSVLHVALRNFSKQPVYSDGKDVMPDVRKVLKQMKSFSDSVHSGKWKGYTGKKIKYIVNIGIG